jgi:hypothetical protein
MSFPGQQELLILDPQPDGLIPCITYVHTGGFSTKYFIEQNPHARCVAISYVQERHQVKRPQNVLTTIYRSWRDNSFIARAQASGPRLL